MTNYQPLDVMQCQLIVGEEEITGGIDGEWITFDIPETQAIGRGADGSYRIVKNNRDITLTVNLASNSPSINYLSSLAFVRQPLIPTPIQFDDFSTGTRFFSTDAIINVNPGTLASNTERQISWTIIMMNATSSFGGLKPIL